MISVFHYIGICYAYTPASIYELYVLKCMNKLF